MVKSVNNNPGVIAKLYNALPARPAFLGGKPVVVKQPDGFCTKVGKLFSGIAGGLRACVTCCGRCSKKPVVANPTYMARMKSAVSSVLGSAVTSVKAHPKKTAAAVVSLVGVGVAAYTGHGQQAVTFASNKFAEAVAFVKTQTA